jgi:hypothetical protein
MKQATQKRNKSQKVKEARPDTSKSQPPIMQPPGLPLSSTAVSGRVGSWGYVFALISITLAAAWLRALRLDHPMRYDEAYAFLYFAFPTSPRAWFDYHEPNNHVLHTLLVHLFTRVGGFYPTTIRLAAFLSGIAIVPVGSYLAQRLTGRWPAALLAAMLLATSNLLIEYSVNARGYSMVCLASLLMGIWTVQICRGFSRTQFWVAWATVAVLGMFTIPIMLYPVAIFTFIILFEIILSPRGKEEKRDVLRRLAFVLGAFVLATILLYLPVVAFNGIHPIVGNRWVSPMPLKEVLGKLPRQAIITLSQWIRDTDWLWRALVSLGVATSIIVGVTYRRIFWVLPLVGAVLLALAAIVQRVVPFPRVWMFMAPLVLVLAACGMDFLTTTLRNRHARFWGSVIVSALVLVSAMHSAWHVHHRPFLNTEDEGTFVEAETVCRDLAAMCDGKTAVIVLKGPAQAPMSYYAAFYHPMKLIDYRSNKCERALVVVDNRQSVDKVAAAHPGFAEHYYPLTVWKTYPHATVYLALRQQASNATGQE